MNTELPASESHGFPSFVGTRVVCTGAGRRGQVAEAVARAFGARGASLILLGHSIAEVGAMSEELIAEGASSEAHACDLTDVHALDGVVRTIGATHVTGIDALVHMAGGFAASGPVAESDPDAWHRQLAINLTTAYLTTRAFLPLLRLRRGAIVYFSSIAALPNGRVAETAAYAAAKTGVLTLMRAVAEEERKHDVRVNAVAPNSIRTATNVATMDAGAKFVEREEVADVVLFLCSAAARAVTGQVIRIG